MKAVNKIIQKKKKGCIFSLVLEECPKQILNFIYKREIRLKNELKQLKVTQMSKKNYERNLKILIKTKKTVRNLKIN